MRRPDSTPEPPRPRWYLVHDDCGVTALGERGPLAWAQIREEGDRVCVEFEVSAVPEPVRLGTDLARDVFRHAALRSERPLLAALPHGSSEVLDEVRRHVPDARIRVAGATCLVQGRVR
ncbi:hypothetical protein [Geodermatophilus ruber]|uniref:Uncharacterized protein n=1 Tax=Geodermatophilus ruber TaxID=504800 RepID=A0A1I4HLV3_9ACTN|nr:hypothetical protein [Geodermatophilus ruber]SFL43165.1 hypothetical protein SAMN04488085_11129 [Geodermatophilus ruber]